jgi:predicted transposase/invertase (TIGR01784 family)
MPKFHKTIHQLKTRFDKWLYVLKNLDRLHEIPEKLKDRIFKKLFKAAEIAGFTPEEAMQYEDSLKVYRDLKNSLDTAREEGIEIGDQRRSEKVALKMLAKGSSFEEISELTDLTIEQIKLLSNNNNNRVCEAAASYGSPRKTAKRRKA